MSHNSVFASCKPCRLGLMCGLGLEPAPGVDHLKKCSAWVVCKYLTNKKTSQGSKLAYVLCVPSISDQKSLFFLLTVSVLSSLTLQSPKFKHFFLPSLFSLVQDAKPLQYSNNVFNLRRFRPALVKHCLICPLRYCRRNKVL